ncbi:MAG: ABC transporter permease subunit [Alphaproteobacteria bacterium]|nr:ABC transporter permease subunit [Alphaproteobacteria bacterium]
MISGSRTLAVFMKELVQMRRDRLTFAIMILIPIIQLTLFGFAINTDPRHLATAVELKDEGPLTRSLLAALKQSSYFDIEHIVSTDEEGEALLRTGKVSFFIVVPQNFERDFVRGDRPQILFSADASDPVAAAGGLGAANEIARTAFAADLPRLRPKLAGAPPPYDIVVHKEYNPAGVTAFNIVPGLLGVILTMTLTMITAIALVRELERGTIEALLSTPVRSVEVMIGKTTPYIFVGAVQAAIIMITGRFLFGIPFAGAPVALIAGITVFVFTNLMLGYLISTVAKTQMQAMQMTFFVFLPSILLSGFMFPFHAMPGWAQAIGECLPVTHFLRIVREVMLKGAGLSDIAGDLWPMGVIFFVIASAALRRFRRTLD